MTIFPDQMEPGLVITTQQSWEDTPHVRPKSGATQLLSGLFYSAGSPAQDPAECDDKGDVIGKGWNNQRETGE